MEILVPISVGVILPVSIVLIVFLSVMNSDNKRAKILIKAIESNNRIDTDKLAESLRKPRKTVRELLNLQLLRGCIFSFIGVALVITAIVTRCSVDDINPNAVNQYFMLGGVSLAVGISYLIVYRVTCKQVDSDNTK